MVISEIHNNVLYNLPCKETVEGLILLQRSLHAKNIGVFQHSQLTANIAYYIADTSGVCFGCTPHQVFIAGLVHDVGKLSVPDAILEKKEGIGDREWEVIKRHPVWGFEFVTGTMFEPYGEVVLCHHEHPDGGGYPSGLSGDKISLSIRLISFSDRIAALLDDRPYRRKIHSFQLLCKEVQKTVAEYFDKKNADAIIYSMIAYLSEWFESTPPLVAISPNASLCSSTVRAPCEIIDIETCGINAACRHLKHLRSANEFAPHGGCNAPN